MTQVEPIDLNRSHITTPEASKKSGLTKGYITLLLRKGKLEGFRYGGTREWFVYVDSLEHFLHQPRKPGPKGPRNKLKTENIATPSTTSDTTLQEKNEEKVEDS